MSPAPGGEGPTAVILNPRSAGGRTEGAWRNLRPKLEAVCGPVTVMETRAPGHGIELAGEAVRSGFSRIFAVGGDGTLNEVVNGVMLTGASPDVVVALIPQGSGSDFQRTLGLPSVESGGIEKLPDCRVAPVDAMRVTFSSPDGSEKTRYAVNVVSFGMGGRVASRANRSSKVLGARLTFLLATLTTALTYRGDRVSIEVDETGIPDIRITNVAAGNGQYHGAGMWVCPGARIDDGVLDVTLVEKLSIPRLVVASRYLFNGRIRSHPKVRTYRTSALAARSLGGRSAIEIDGEPLGYLPIRIEIVPAALRMLVPETVQDRI